MSFSESQLRYTESGVSIKQLIDAARTSNDDALGQLLLAFRRYMTNLATPQLRHKLQRRVATSDVVQEATLAACRDFAQFRGTTEQEFSSWLRKILLNCLHRAVEKHVKTEKRSIRREVSVERLQKASEQSTLGFLANLPDQGPSPSSCLKKHELSVGLAEQLSKLKPDYRDVVILRNVKGLSFQQIALRMERDSAAVRMLWLRAIAKLQDTCQEFE